MLVLLGVLGLVGTLDVTRLADDVLHLATGVLFVYTGSGRTGDWSTRVTVGVVGALYVIEGMINPVRSLLDELPIVHYENGVDAAHVAFGLLSISATMLLPNGGASRAARQERP